MKEPVGTGAEPIDEATLAQMNGQYVMPPDAGPAWRAAYEAGIDMSLIEENLRLTPWERLVANDSALSLVRAIEGGSPADNGATN
jgi:hypothetical protein